jgi:hypothetical protein
MHPLGSVHQLPVNVHLSKEGLLKHYYLLVHFVCRAVADHVRRLDSTRPVTMALARGYGEDRTVSISYLTDSK